MSIVAKFLIGILVIFSARRMLWVMASWLRRRPSTMAARWPDVLIAVAFRDEQDSLPRLLSSLDALDYDPAQRSICLVDDASTDGSSELALAWTRERPHARFLRLENSVGKAEALNRVLASAAAGPEVVVVYDADQRPHFDSLRRLMAPFGDPTTEAVCGYRRPVICRLNPVAAYSCLEAWTHQLVNLAAKDVLRLNPPTMGGNCAYRRSALARVGGFPAGSLSEDIEVSLAMAGSGGTTRFVRAAVSDDDVAESWTRHVNQRFRWSMGLAASRRHVRGLETAFVATGYLDRIVLLLTIACSLGGYVSPWWLVVYAVPAVATAVTAMVKARPGLWLACMVVVVSPPMFVADVLISVAAAGSAIMGRPIPWISRRAAASSESH